LLGCAAPLASKSWWRRSSSQHRQAKRRVAKRVREVLTDTDLSTCRLGEEFQREDPASNKPSQLAEAVHAFGLALE
jgi:hypothetical protein